MAEVRTNLNYAASHEWIELEDGIATVGISDYAQEALGDVVFVELPEMDQAYQAGDEIAVIESVKAASDIYAPVAGIVVAVNEALEAEPEVVNNSPYEAGWIFKLSLSEPEAAQDLLTAEQYLTLCESQDH
jgi:glycine cleavage system H protein